MVLKTLSFLSYLVHKNKNTTVFEKTNKIEGENSPPPNQLPRLCVGAAICPPGISPVAFVPKFFDIRISTHSIPDNLFIK